MVSPLRSILLPVAVALLIGLAAGRMMAPAETASPGPAPKTARGTPARPARQHLEWEALLREYEAEELSEYETGIDALDLILDRWSGAELKAALDEAMVTPRCIAPLGRNNNLVWRLFGAWVRQDPDAATTWLDGVASGEFRDGFVGTACRNWPADRAMDGIDFLLNYEWAERAYYHHILMEAAIETEARRGPAAVEHLLQRLQQGEAHVNLETVDLPAEFDYPPLVDSEAFRAAEKEMFQDRILSEWIDDQPRNFLAWMQRAGEWREFNKFLQPARAAKMPEATAFFGEIDPDARGDLLKSVKWKSLKFETISSFADGLRNPEAQVAWVADAVRQSLGYNNKKLDAVAVLGLVPSGDRQVEVLRQVDPHTDWRPDATPKRGESPAKAAIRKHLEESGVEVPPPLVRPDPFADP